VSAGSIRTALTDIDAEKSGTTTASDVLPEPEPVPEPTSDASPEPEPGSGSAGGRVPVLADPVDRTGERVLAAFGMIASAPPVFTGCARAPLAGLFLAVPALAATGLIECAHDAYPSFPNGFYSLDTMLCEAVFRALLGESRAEGATRIDPVALGRVLGLDRAPEVRRSAARSATWPRPPRPATGSRLWPAATPTPVPTSWGCSTSTVMCAPTQGTRKIAKTHVPRLKFPAPATRGDPGCATPPGTRCWW